MRFSIKSKILLSLCIALACTVPAVAAKAPADTVPPLTSYRVFKAIPQQQLDILSSVMREDMVDYILADSVAKIPNVYTGLSWIEEASDDYMQVHLTDVSTLTVKILPYKKGESIAMTLYTLGTGKDTSDTTVRFYSDTMEELPRKKFLPLPSKDDIFLFRRKTMPDGSPCPAISDHEKDELSDLLPFRTFEASVAPDSDTLTLTLTSLNYLTTEARGKLEPWLNTTLTYTWTPQGYKLQK